MAGLALVCLAPALLVMSFGTPDNVVCFLVLLFAGFLVFLRILFRYQPIHVADDSDLLLDQTIRLRPDALEVDWASSNARYAWRSPIRCEINKKSVWVYLGKASVLVIPFRAFAGQSQIREFRSLCNSYLANGATDFVHRVNTQVGDGEVAVSYQNTPEQYLEVSGQSTAKNSIPMQVCIFVLGAWFIRTAGTQAGLVSQILLVIGIGLTVWMALAAMGDWFPALLGHDSDKDFDPIRVIVSAAGIRSYVEGCFEEVATWSAYKGWWSHENYIAIDSETGGSAYLIPRREFESPEDEQTLEDIVTRNLDDLRQATSAVPEFIETGNPYEAPSG